MKITYAIEYIIKIIIVALLQTTLLTACNQSSVVTTVKAVQIDNATQVSSQGNTYTIQFSPALNSMPLNQYFDLEVQIKGSTHQTITFPLELEIDAGMKAHNHGMNVSPKIINLGNGKFKVEGMLFHMPGKWFLSFTIRRGTLSEKAEINLVIAP